MANGRNYKLKLTSASQKDVDKLPAKIKIDLLNKHFPKLRLSSLTSSKRLSDGLKGLYSYHFGHRPEYRILFQLIADEVIILMIGKRENFYKEAYRRFV